MISIGWLTSSVDSSVHLVMSIVSHCLLYTHHVHLILLFRLCVDMGDIPPLCMTVCCMTTFLLYDCLSHVYVGCTCISLSPNLKSRSTLYLLVLCLQLETCFSLLAFRPC